MPYDIEQVVGLTARQDIPAGQELRWTQLG